MRASRPLMLLFFALLTDSCGGADTGVSTGLVLSLPQVRALVDESADVMGGSINQAQAAQTINKTLNCPGGGTTVATGNLTGTTSLLNGDVTFAYQNCRTINYTRSGSVRVTGSLTSGGARQGTFTGTLTVGVLGGTSGSCAVDFAITRSGSQAPYSVTGTICNANVAGTY